MTKHVAMLTLALFAVAFSGCTDADPKESELIDKTTTQKPVFTSTTPAPEPVADEPDAVEDAEKAAEAVEAVDEIEPVKEPAMPSFDPVVETVDGLTIVRFVTTSEIAKREPVAPGTSFETDHERIYAFIEASNESTSEKRLMVHFIGPETTVSGGIELHIPASVPRWRTWAYTRHAKKPGLWRVEIRDLDGKLLGALPFEVVPGI